MRDHGLVVAERRVPPRGAQETCLPRHPTAWRPRKHRQEVESAHGLAMQVLEIADGADPHDSPQLIKNRCDQRRWLAGKYNPFYSDKVAVTDHDGGSIATRLAKMSAADAPVW